MISRIFHRSIIWEIICWVQASQTIGSRWYCRALDPVRKTWPNSPEFEYTRYHASRSVHRLCICSTRYLGYYNTQHIIHIDHVCFCTTVYHTNKFVTVPPSTTQTKCLERDFERGEKCMYGGVRAAVTSSRRSCEFRVLIGEESKCFSRDFVCCGAFCRRDLGAV